MNVRTIGSFAAKAAAIILSGALIAGCSANRHLLPAMQSNGPAVPAGVTPADGSDHRMVATLVSVRIPRRTSRRPEAHPATISPLTQSLSIAVNTAQAQIFNATPASPGCVGGATGITCTFAVRAPAGTDTFTVTTYSLINAKGTALDRGIAALVPIAKGKANHVAIHLGPLVTTVANSGPGSLRYAIASAGSGDTVLFSLPKGSTIALSSPILLTGTVAIAGPGAADLSLSGGGAHQLFQVVGTATISGLTLLHGKAAVASAPGGAIQNAGALTLANDVFSTSTSIVSLRRAPGKRPALRMRGLHPHCTTVTHEGGAIYNDGTLTISGTTFTGNVITSNLPSCIEGEGGAIFNDLAGTLNSTNDKYLSNSAVLGGAVYNAGLGGVTFTNDAFTGNYGCTAASGCPTSGCGATSCTSFAVGDGAAIYDAGIGITVTGSTFTSNVAGGKTAGSQGQGGAIYLNSTLPTITKTTFVSNLAGGGTTSCSTGDGGAIFAVNAIEIDNDIFKGNAATGDVAGAGGAIVSPAAITGTGDTFTGNAATSIGGPCTASSEGIGGAAYSGTTATFSNSTFTGNSATGGQTGAGGALAATNGIVSTSTFASNTALGTGLGGASGVIGGGGALYFSTIGKISNSTFTSNTVTAETINASAAIGGGAVVVSGSLLSTNDTFTSNSATMKTGPQTAGGGGVAAVGGSLVSTGDKFVSNWVTGPHIAGGGGAFAGNGLLMSNTVLSSNKATAPQAIGGALAIGSSGIIKRVTVTGNTADGTTVGGGGGIYDTAGSQITDSIISQNTATSFGGGIYSTSNPEVLLESSVSNNAVSKANAASAGGGGIFESGGVELSQVTIAGNTVTVSGPGPAGGAGILVGGGLLAIDSTISGNKLLGTAPQSGGGGFLNGSSVDLINTTVSNNSSSIDGGGFDNFATSGVSFANVTLFKNVATGKGGNLYNNTSAALTLTNSVIGGGTAATGHDIDNLGTITSGGYNIMQTVPAGTALSGTLTGNLTADPKLLALSNNGGPTFTNADQATSPGKQHIPYAASSCGSLTIAADQRGFTRGAGGHCDSGAYEYAGVATAIVHRPKLSRMALRKSSIRGPISGLPHITLPKIVINL